MQVASSDLGKDGSMYRGNEWGGWKQATERGGGGRGGRKHGHLDYMGKSPSSEVENLPEKENNYMPYMYGMSCMCETTFLHTEILIITILPQYKQTSTFMSKETNARQPLKTPQKATLTCFRTFHTLFHIFHHSRKEKNSDICLLQKADFTSVKVTLGHFVVEVGFYIWVLLSSWNQYQAVFPAPPNPQSFKCNNYLLNNNLETIEAKTVIMKLLKQNNKSMFLLLLQCCGSLWPFDPKINK